MVERRTRHSRFISTSWRTLDFTKRILDSQIESIAGDVAGATN
jgi:hypothetical protein